jgi:hypothetical protein
MEDLEFEKETAVSSSYETLPKQTINSRHVYHSGALQEVLKARFGAGNFHVKVRGVLELKADSSG